MSYVFLILITLYTACSAWAYDGNKDYLHSADARKIMDQDASFVAFDHILRYSIEINFSEEGQCAGLLLKSGYMLTARHCIESLLAPISGYDEALPRAEILRRIRAYDTKYGLRLSLHIFSSRGSTPVMASVAAIGAGLRIVNAPSGMRDRIAKPGEQSAGADEDWVLLNLGTTMNTDCVPLSTQNYGQVAKLFVVGAPVENDDSTFISGDEIRVSLGASVDLAHGIDLTTKDDIIDGKDPGNTYSTIYALTGFTSAAVLPGYSGGGVLDAKGGYLGVTSFMLSHFQESAFAPIVEVRKQWASDQLVLSDGSSPESFFCQN